MHDDAPTLDIMELATMEDDVPLDDVLGTFKNHRARYVIYYLHGLSSADLPVSLTQLADAVTAWRATETDMIATAEDRDRMRIRLYHSHLPKLDDLGYLTFNPNSNTITGIDIPPFVESLLELTDE